MYPLRSRTTYTETLDNEVCVYEWIRHEVHALNATAAGVWQLCDGKTTVAEMVERLRVAQLPYPEQLVDLALEEFQRKHLLEADPALPIERPAISRRVLMRRGLTAALLPVVTSIVAPTPLQAQSPGARSQTFAFTGASQTFVVPSGATSLTVSAFGAQGRRGGLGGSVTATLTVTPGETLFINVGGAPAVVTSPPAADVNEGGFNGGGRAGGSPFNLVGPVGPGGGASDVRRGGSALGNRVVVAGGGGGSGSSPIGTGGAGGGTNGGSGGGSDAGGGGGTQTAGGAAGTGPPPFFPGVQPATAGELGIGGDGGSSTFSLAISSAGGGGGGGYYGGGGGGAGAGGGGGSSFAHPSATGVVHVQGTRTGAGLIILTW